MNLAQLLSDFIFKAVLRDFQTRNTSKQLTDTTVQCEKLDVHYPKQSDRNYMQGILECSTLQETLTCMFRFPFYKNQFTQFHLNQDCTDCA